MDTIKPLVRIWEDTLAGYRQDNEDAKQILRRFDEVLLEKASKFSVEQLEKSLKNYSEKYELVDVTKLINLKHSEAEKMIQRVHEISEKNFNDIRNNFSMNFTEIEKTLKK